MYRVYRVYTYSTVYRVYRVYRGHFPGPDAVPGSVSIVVLTCSRALAVYVTRMAGKVPSFMVFLKTSEEQTNNNNMKTNKYTFIKTINVTNDASTSWNQPHTTSHYFHY